jgi:glutathione peroxidase
MTLRPTLIAISLILGMMCTAAEPNPLEIPVKDIRGKELKLRDLGAKAFLIVNVASECGYTSQYAGLEQLYQSLKGMGLIVIGVPCNDFGGQEPGSNPEILKFCTSQYRVTFPMLEKITISGENSHELFKALTSKEHGIPGAVSWNFNKFLLSKEGRVVRRFDSGTEPDSTELTAAIQKLLVP